MGALKKNEGTKSRILKRTLKQNYRKSTYLPLPPSRFVVAPTRITREQRKVDKKKQRRVGPKILSSKEDSTIKMIHKLHLKEQEEKEILASCIFVEVGSTKDPPGRRCRNRSNRFSCSGSVWRNIGRHRCFSDRKSGLRRNQSSR